MTATEALERRIDELCRENERLRQENQSIGMAAYELGRASLADENAKLRGARDVWQENDAKLRELIADLWEYIHIGTAQDGQSLHDRTRELGIGDSDEWSA